MRGLQSRAEAAVSLVSLAWIRLPPSALRYHPTFHLMGHCSLPPFLFSPAPGVFTPHLRHRQQGPVGGLSWWMDVGGPGNLPKASLHLMSPAYSSVGSTVTFAMFFRHTCSDIKSILLHRYFRCQGLQAGSPQLLPGTSPTGGCRALGWVTPPAPQKTSSPATPQPLSSKRSARSSSGSPRNRAPCRTSIADRPRLADLPSIRFPWKQDQKEIN